jgi:hypothetical protein
MGTQVIFAEQVASVFVVPGTEYLLIYDIVGDVLRIRRVWTGHRAQRPFDRSSEHKAQIGTDAATDNRASGFLR